MIVINRFSCGMLMASVALFSNYSLARGDTFEVVSPTTVQNGAAGNADVLNGADTLNITPEGRIKVEVAAGADGAAKDVPLLAVKATGIGNTVENEGKISAIRKTAGADPIIATTRGISSEVADAAAAAADDAAVKSTTITNAGDLTAEAIVESNVTGIFSGVTVADADAAGAVAGAAAGVTVAITNSGNLIAKSTAAAAASEVSGIRSMNMNADITNSGDLTASTTGTGAVWGIYSGVTVVAGDGAAVVDVVTVDITNSGNLTAKSTGNGPVRGIYARGKKVAITNSGKLGASTTGTGDVRGIYADAVADAKVVITNSGELGASTTGTNAVTGIFADAAAGANVAITNSGKLGATTTGTGSVWGIYADAAAGANVAISNSGIISAIVTGEGNVTGIYAVAAGANVAISNSGKLDVSKTDVDGNVRGIYARAVADANVAISNSGIINASTKGAGVVTGIYVDAAAGANVVITNSGELGASTTGVRNVYGVKFRRGGSGGSLVNSGTITASGIGNHEALISYAVGGSGAITISNSGSIIGSVKNNIAAINLMNGGSLEFGKGSFIVGDMLLDGGDTSISIDGDQPRSLHYVFGGAGGIAGGKPKVSGSYPAFYSEDGREVAILDTRHLNAGIDALEVMTGSVSGLIRSRRFVQDVSKSHVWVSGALSRNKIGNNGKNDGFFAMNNGDRSFAVGVDGSPSAGFSVGGLVGTNVGSKMVAPADKVSSSYENSTDGLFGAVHAIQRFDHVFLQTAVSGGFLKHNDERFIQDNTVDSGIDVARSSYHSYWYSPEVTLGVGISAFDWTYTPSVNLRYARQLVGAYEEEGSQSNVKYDGRSISLLSGRAGLAVDRQFSSTHLTLRTGLQSFGLIGRTDASLGMLDGSKQTFVMQSGHKKGIYGGVDVAMQLSQNASVTLGGEAIFSKDKKMKTYLTAGLDVAF